jgi:1-acyl-sn-glycerol-3-phosphate acyltransferase
MAKATGLPILPVAIRGTIDVLPRGTSNLRTGRRVDVCIGEPIDVANLDVPALMERVRGFLVERVER